MGLGGASHDVPTQRELTRGSVRWLEAVRFQIPSPSETSSPGKGNEEKATHSPLDVKPPLHGFITM